MEFFKPSIFLFLFCLSFVVKSDSFNPEQGEAKNIMLPFMQKAWFPGQNRDQYFDVLNKAEISFLPGSYSYAGQTECLGFCRVTLANGLKDGMAFLFKKVNGKWADGRWFESGLVDVKTGNANNDEFIDLILQTETPGDSVRNGMQKVVTLKGGKPSILYKTATFDKSKTDLSKLKPGEKMAIRINLYLADTDNDGKNEVVEVIETGVLDHTVAKGLPIKWAKTKNVLFFNNNYFRKK